MISDSLKPPLSQLLLSIADDKLMLGHRNSDWTGLGPILEEDIAFSHLAQDEIAHAQALYDFVGQMLGRKADDLAFGRPPTEYRCASIVELPDEFDWATALCRQFFCDHLDRIRLARLSKSSHKPLADLASRLAAEEQVHVEHSDGWIKRLGRGNAESRKRVQKAMDSIAPAASMLFEPVEGEQSLIDAGLYPGGGPQVFEQWRSGLIDIAQSAGLRLALTAPSANARGGRHGVHTEHLKPLLDEMCEVYRLEPGAAW